MPKAARIAARGASPRAAEPAPLTVPRAGVWVPRVVLAVILVTTALVRVRLLTVPLERDEGEFAYMGQLILRGEIPYLAAHNMKLPGVYYAYAAILAVFGESEAGIRLGLLLVNLASIILIHRLGQRLLDETAGLTAAAAYAVLSLGVPVLGFTAKAEHFVVFFLLAGMLLLAHAGARRRLGLVAAAGFLLGVAVVMKQHAAAFVAFGAVYLVLIARREELLTAFVVFTLAAAAPFAATCVAMAWAGAFGPFWFWTVTYAREYATLLPAGVGLGELAKRAGEIAAAGSALWLLAGLGLAAPAWDEGARRAAPFLLPFAVCSFVAVCPGLRFSEHYFILLLPAAALLIGVAVSGLARLAERRQPRFARLVRVGVPLVAVLLALAQQWPLLALSPVALSRMVYGVNPFPEAIEIGRYLREHSAPDEQIAVIGSEPEIYFYAHRRAATSYMYTYPMMEPQPFARQMQEDMIAQLERARPRFLVLVNVDTSWSRRPDSSNLLLEWAERTVNDGYQPVGVVDIWRDRDATFAWDAAARAAQPRSQSHVVAFERRR
jgi:Dolichyl-phosphate-mannose-protein mannosyltransferase